MAETGRGISFGQHEYIGTLANIISDDPRGSSFLIGSRMRIRNANETPSRPDRYVTNIGVTRLTAEGSHAALINQLKQLPSN